MPVPWSREGHADFPKPRREQTAALVRAGASLCLATSNPSAFHNAWNEFVMETYLPAEIQPMAAQVRLRFAVEDAPNLCVATTPFRLDMCGETHFLDTDRCVCLCVAAVGVALCVL